jgi:hypothetical protein
MGRLASRFEEATQTRLAGIDHEVEVALGKLDALNVAAGHAMSGVVRVKLGQKTLELLAPDASAHLAMISDDHFLCTRDVLTGLNFTLRRL